MAIGSSDTRSSGAIRREPKATQTGFGLHWLNVSQFRFLYLLDAFVIFSLLCAVNLMRFGMSAAYGASHYMTGFAITVTIIMIVNYFTGLYERDPRLGLRPWGPALLLLWVYQHSSVGFSPSYLIST